MKNISPIELSNLINSNNNDYQLIDIRDDYEYDICCIGGEKISMYSIIKNINKLSKSKKVIIYCRTGSRSSNIIDLIEKKFQYKNIYNLEGGIMKWREDIDPTLEKY
tara:strand:- start:1955 stop:2275 length:321 start_codon:yes stop_codon:yes gene_type:complete